MIIDNRRDRLSYLIWTFQKSTSGDLLVDLVRFQGGHTALRHLVEVNFVFGLIAFGETDPTLNGHALEQTVHERVHTDIGNMFQTLDGLGVHHRQGHLRNGRGMLV